MELGEFSSQFVQENRILSLSEGTLRKSIKSDPEIAATLLNISKILCKRVLKG